MRNSLISLLILFFFGACSNQVTKGLQESKISVPEVHNPFFSNPQLDYVYKLRMDAYGRFFGGILIIKKLGPEEHRLVLTSEFGGKLLDFSFVNGQFSKNFIVADLDNKVLVNTLEKDFYLLIKEHADVLGQFRSDERVILQTHHMDSFGYYYTEGENGHVDEIVFTSKHKMKMRIGFLSSDSDVAKQILIEHFNIKLKMELEYLEKEYWKH